MASILPAGITNGVKGLDANRYATKKTVAQGMLDIALLTSNASQLKYVLQVGQKHEFYTLLVILISVSIVLQVAMGLVLLTLNLLRDCRFQQPRHRASAHTINYLTTATAFLLVGLMFVVIGGLDLNDHEDQPSAIILNDVIVIFIFTISVLNIVISAFGIEYSNNPLAIAGVLALIISSLDDENNHKRKKIADGLYYLSVGLMTGVVFCDVIKMTFGFDPALSEQDYYRNS
ncbi:Ninjurin-2 [Papilio xuthus]|uniref:Ninjurin-2 n=1 Tax=Papilio xuthus TaxID=66420 RepID=A0A194QCG7_PAPXU|nr:Ninjurin-2 [Papilio xuthus]